MNYRITMEGRRVFKEIGLLSPHPALPQHVVIWSRRDYHPSQAHWSSPIQYPNVLRFETRREQDGVPAVTIRDFLKATLRHRPDRIILGEIRGREAFDLLQLLNTGHSGAISTVHANSAAQGISRFTTCVLQSGVEMLYNAIKANVAESLNVVVQMERRPGARFVSEVSEILGYDPEADRYRLGFVYCRQGEAFAK